VRASLIGVVLAVACSKGDERKASAPAPAAPPVAVEETTVACESLPFEVSTPVPEASGAAWLDIDGEPSLVVIADSGHDGMFGIVDPETGVTRSTGKLPLGSGANDDLEGAAARNGRLVAITSSGFIREWEWRAGAFALVAGPYAIGGADMICENKLNCGKNYEGLAIAPAPIGGCAGYACSKDTGKAYCLRDDGGKLTVTGNSISLADRSGVLADCAFDEHGTLYAGNNLFGLAATFRLTNLADPAHAVSVPLGPLGTGFPETVAARGDIVYRMSDIGGEGPSLMFKFRCSAAGR
jgi:hypothetical protein